MRQTIHMASTPASLSSVASVAASPSSCRFSQSVVRLKSVEFQQETTHPASNIQQKVTQRLGQGQGQAVTYSQQQTLGIRILGTGSTDIPEYSATQEVPVSFASRMRCRPEGTQNNLSMTQLTSQNNRQNHEMKERRKSNRKSKSTYKHVPHREKPAHLVARRNARERRRVQAVNSAFLRLRRHVPHENKHKRLSKVKTLHIAIDYIHYLRNLIEDYDARVEGQQQQQQQQRQQQQLINHPGCTQPANFSNGHMLNLNNTTKENQHWMHNSLVSGCDVRDMFTMEGFSQFHQG